MWWNQYLHNSDIKSLNSSEELPEIAARAYLSTELMEMFFLPQIDALLLEYSKDELETIVSEFIEQRYDVRSIFDTEKVWTTRKVKFARMLLNSI